MFQQAPAIYGDDPEAPLPMLRSPPHSERASLAVGDSPLKTLDEVLDSLKETHAEFLQAIQSDLQFWTCGQSTASMRSNQIALRKPLFSRNSYGHNESHVSGQELEKPQDGKRSMSEQVVGPAESSRSDLSVWKRTSFMRDTFLKSRSPTLFLDEQKRKKKDMLAETRFKQFLKSPMFDKISAVLVVTNCAFIGLQVESMFWPEAPMWVAVVDYLYSLTFLIELILRLYSHGTSFFCSPLDRAGNTFDFLVVVLTLIDSGINLMFSSDSLGIGNVSILRILRIVRVTRVLRIIRMLTFFKDLRILIAAIGSTLKTASFAITLLLIIMYVFAIAITQFVAQYWQDQSGEIPEQMSAYFGSIWLSIYTLFIVTTSGVDWQNVLSILDPVGPIVGIVFCAFIALMNLCVLNVLTGIFCQCAIETAALDRDNVIQWQLAERQRYFATLSDIFQDFDAAYDGTCSYKQFEQRLSDERLQALLRSLDIEVRDALALFEMLDWEGNGAVSLEDFVSSCITLRGGAKAVHMEKMQRNYNKIETRLREIDGKLEPLQHQVLRVRSDASSLGSINTVVEGSTTSHPSDQKTMVPKNVGSNLSHKDSSPHVVAPSHGVPRPPASAQMACLPNAVYEKPVVNSTTMLSDEYV